MRAVDSPVEGKCWLSLGSGKDSERRTEPCCPQGSSSDAPPESPSLLRFHRAAWALLPWRLMTTALPLNFVGSGAGTHLQSIKCNRLSFSGLVRTGTGPSLISWTLAVSTLSTTTCDAGHGSLGLLRLLLGPLGDSSPSLWVAPTPSCSRGQGPGIRR